jgi:hypothetical protein
MVGAFRILPFADEELPDQLLDALLERRSSLPTAWVGPRACDQAAVRAQQRVGLHQEARPAGLGNARLTAASRTRSAGLSLGRPTCRRSMVVGGRAPGYPGLGGVAAGQQDEQLERAAERQVGEP